MLLNDQLTLRAMKILGVEKHPSFRAVESILKDGRVDIHIRPVDGKYR